MPACSACARVRFAALAVCAVDSPLQAAALPSSRPQLGLDRGPKDTRQKEDLEFGKKHLTQAQLAEAKASSSKDTYKKQWR